MTILYFTSDFSITIQATLAYLISCFYRCTKQGEKHRSSSFSEHLKILKRFLIGFKYNKKFLTSPKFCRNIQGSVILMLFIRVYL